MSHLVRKIASVAIATLTLASSANAFAQSTQGTQAAQGEDRTETTVRPNRGLLITGGAIIAASYIPPVIVAATSEREGDQYLYIPIAGPWIDLGERGGCGPDPCGEEAVYKGLLVATGIAHLVGTGLIVSSFIIPENRDTESRARASASKSTTHVSKPMVVPAQVGRGGAGFALVGTF